MNPLFAIGQTVYYLVSAGGEPYEVKEGVIRGIEVSRGIQPKYHFENGIFNIRYPECDIFDDRDKAIKEALRRNNIHSDKCRAIDVCSY